MMQYSIYVRTCPNRDFVNVFKNVLRNFCLKMEMFVY